MGVASSSSSDDVDARWTRDENVDEDAGEDVNAGTTTSGTTTSGTTNDDETMTFVEELEDGSTRVVRLDDDEEWDDDCLLYTSPSPRDQRGSRMPSSA